MHKFDPCPLGSRDLEILVTPISTFALSKVRDFVTFVGELYKFVDSLYIHQQWKKRLVVETYFAKCT